VANQRMITVCTAGARSWLPGTGSSRGMYSEHFICKPAACWCVGLYLIETLEPRPVNRDCVNFRLPHRSRAGRKPASRGPS
jgi:hypothetical protein